MAERRSAENKGKPSGKYAETKKDAGRQGDLKEIRPTAGAQKKRRSAEPTIGTTGGHSRKR